MPHVPSPPQPSSCENLKSPTDRLRYLYADVRRISEIAAPELVLHPADRDLTSPPRAPLRGVAACQVHEEALVAATGETLVMDVESITVGADGVFGCVLGVLRAGETKGEHGQMDGDGDGEENKVGSVKKRSRGVLAVPFCGLWRFDQEGRAVEHWENAADPAAVAKWLTGE
ncbi:hypothetical protein N656DRAFT_840689 [Canariomyces notabilis]|uniref:Uncharacterized protein n=1 Tax=Canariomyces notabilis TaxID=2074819 RepID=A0AAN6TM39_9PEZI|nr:hypothetical protein N656DRAFT_840689 [Canariomyces arenarius]